MDIAECFQYYNPVIKEYIASRIKSQYLRQGVYEKAFRDLGYGFVII